MHAVTLVLPRSQHCIPKKILNQPKPYITSDFRKISDDVMWRKASRMQDSNSSNRKSYNAIGTSEARIWWHALLELRGGRVAISLIVVILMLLCLYLAF